MFYVQNTQKISTYAVQFIAALVRLVSKHGRCYAFLIYMYYGNSIYIILLMVYIFTYLHLNSLLHTSEVFPVGETIFLGSGATIAHM